MPLAQFSANSGSYAKIHDPSKLTFYTSLDPDEAQRLSRYSLYWKFYLGDQWDFAREGDEPLVQMNYFGKFIDKHVEFLTGKGFETSVCDALENTHKPFLEEVWAYNGKRELTEAIALTGAVTGDSFVHIGWEEPSALERRIHPYSQGKIRIYAKGSEQVFPKWSSTDIGKMESVKIVTAFYENSSDPQSTNGQLTIRLHTLTITPDVYMEQFDGSEPKLQPNSLGEIPVVHIKNLIVPGEPYGKSDGHDIVPLQRELNEKSTDISDTINYHSAPITVITGAKAKQLVKGPRELWSGLPPEAKVFNLALEGDLGAANTYWDKVKKAMHEIGDIPEGALGQMQAISNTSGVALHMQYGPILGRRQRKLATYEPGLARINYFILRIGALKGLIKTPFDICEKCGGKILLIDNNKMEKRWNTETKKYDDVKVLEKKCVRINKNTLEIERPEEVKVKIWREYGFGGELKSVTLAEANQIADGKKSYWDYASEQFEAIKVWRDEVKAVRARNAKRQKEYADQGVVGITGASASADPQAKASVLFLEPEPPPPMDLVQQIPMGEIDIPEEPIQVNYEEKLINPETGDEVETIRATRLVIPTGCETPKYLDPFKTEVELNNALPKDLHLDAQLYRVYQANGWVDRMWAQDQIPEIAREKTEINKRLRAEMTSGMPQPAAQPTWTPGKQQPPITDYSPAQQNGAAVPGKSGNPTSPSDPQIR